MKKAIILSSTLVFIITGCSLTQTKTTQDVIGPEEAQTKVVNFINNNLVQPGSEVSIKEITEEDGLYKAVLDMANGQEITSYLTKDGKKFFPQVMDIEAIEKEAQEAKTQKSNTETAQAQQAQQAPKEYSDEDIEKIKNFVDCLASKDFKIYGANWCGWTKKLTVETFGGFDVVEPIYIECTEEKDLCSEEGVSGYPTIKINGDKYQGQRNFADFAKATGCEAPDVAEQSSSGTGDCN